MELKKCKKCNHLETRTHGDIPAYLVADHICTQKHKPIEFVDQNDCEYESLFGAIAGAIFKLIGIGTVLLFLFTILNGIFGKEVFPSFFTIFSP